MSKLYVSVVIPALNESENIGELIKRIDRSLKSNYEIIVIDDNSTDGTYEAVREMSANYPVIVQRKIGVKGKGRSLMQGFSLAKGEFIAAIDADLQYPPEKIPEMVAKIVEEKYDIVIGSRSYKSGGVIRFLAHYGFRLMFVKLLHNLDVDSQSGLKVFRRKVLNYVNIKSSGWTSDLEFLLQSVNAGFKITSVKVDFGKRYKGKSKVHTLNAAYEIGSHAVRSKINPALNISEYNHPKLGKLIFYKGRRYSLHTGIKTEDSAMTGLNPWQKLSLTTISFVLAFLFFLNFHLSLFIFITFISIIYFMDLIYNFYLIYKSFYDNREINVKESDLANLYDSKLPVYTILVPLYKEAGVLPQLIDGISSLNYPKDKLQVILLLEKDDRETISVASSANLPDFFEINIVPQSEPKTKPKACNYGLMGAKGEYVVIYDAEDIPDPDQLKKVVSVFNKSGDSIQCVQAKLNFYNKKQNIITKLFTGEYSLWFDLILPGLQSLDAPIPLGGTSNHFRTSFLREVGGWDPFNVTEDCDLGIRMSRKGFRTAIINSETAEEANSSLSNWINQRTRWIKGYIQTYLVHTRNVRAYIRGNGWRNFLDFQVVVGLKIFSILVNPFMWFMFLTYFLFRNQLGSYIESLYNPIIFYIATLCLVVGNFAHFYYYMIALSKKGEDSLVKYAYLVPVYWIFMSIAAWIALYKLIKEPFYWSKTVHGLHIAKDPSPLKQIRLAFDPDIEN